MPSTRAPEHIFAGLAAILLIVAAFGLIVGRDDDEGSSSTTAASGGGTEVDIADFAFSPDELTVSVGDTVTWTNQDGDHPHRDRHRRRESSDELGQGDTYDRTFDEAGEFTYACAIHPSMEGTVVIEE